MRKIIRTENISKEFSGVYVLKDISVDIEEGEIFGIIGENGAGKSTFIKILNGTFTPTKGRIFFDEKPVYIRDASVAKHLGIATIPQEVNLINTLRVYENIFLGNESFGRFRILNKRDMIQKVRELFETLETEIDPQERIASLSIAQRRMVEIAKAISQNPRVLIMDEPTESLTFHEVRILFDLIKRLKERGVTIIYISHKLKEIKNICDRVMILRDGDLISVDKITNIDENEMARRMVGRELSTIFPSKVIPSNEIVLEVKDLTIDGLLHSISFDLRKGEVLGFAGLIGSGRTELAEAIIGIRKINRGKIFIKGKECRINSPEDAVRYSIGYLSEDRQGIGILRNFSVKNNITLTSLPNYCNHLGLIDIKKEIDKAYYYIDTFEIKTHSLDTKLEFLSGGNQQKVSFAKTLDAEPKILILDEPTRGIDVGTKRDIYNFIHNLASSGLSCILISSELEEIIGMCNRVAVMHNGRITGILEGDEINEEEIMLYATGLKEKGETYG
ncbi:MAG: sugar ABC transporter ATP-binding protein [bacterium]